MKNIREDIRIFQDAKNNKTTIVCFNLSEKTKKKLIEDLLGDIQAVETVEGVTCTAPDMSEEVTSVEEMQQMQDLNSMIAGQSIPRAIMTLASFYNTSKQSDVPAKINELIKGNLYNFDDNAIKAVLYSLKDIYSDKLNSFAEFLGFGNPKGRDDRDQCIQQAIANACRDTLQDALSQIVF